MQDKQFSVIILVIFANFVLKCRGFPANICYGLEALEIIPHPETCTKYILCALGVPTVVDCEPNHIFNPNTRRCVPGNTNTCELYATPITTSTTTSVTQTEPQTTSVPPESTINDSTDDTTVPVLSTTDQELKTDETSTASTTELGTATTTELSTESTPISEITITTTTSAAAPIHRCPPGGNGYIPHHTNCSRYFECINGIRHLRFCHDELLFDSVTLRCTYPELAVCAGTK